MAQTYSLGQSYLRLERTDHHKMTQISVPSPPSPKDPLWTDGTPPQRGMHLYQDYASQIGLDKPMGR